MRNYLKDNYYKLKESMSMKNPKSSLRGSNIYNSFIRSRKCRLIVRRRRECRCLYFCEAWLCNDCQSMFLKSFHVFCDGDLKDDPGYSLKTIKFNLQRWPFSKAANFLASCTEELNPSIKIYSKVSSLRPGIGYCLQASSKISRGYFLLIGIILFLVSSSVSVE